MGSYVKPGIKLGLHDMAGGTEKRRLRFGQQTGWAETQKQPPSSNQHEYPHKKLPPFLSSMQSCFGTSSGSMLPDGVLGMAFISITH